MWVEQYAHLLCSVFSLHCLESTLCEELYDTLGVEDGVREASTYGTYGQRSTAGTRATLSCDVAAGVFHPRSLSGSCR